MTELSPLTKTGVVVAVAAALGVVAAFALPGVPFHHHHPGLLATLVRVQFGVATFDLVCLFALVGAYVDVYRSLPNKYTASLLVTSVALLLYALSSNPLVPLLFGFPPRPAGPFTFLPDVFVGAAIVVLFYQSQT